MVTALMARVDRRQGEWGARSRSRRDEDEGGREKGRDSDDIALLATQRGGGVEERGVRWWEVATR
jgi:hypothetical protein